MLGTRLVADCDRNLMQQIAIERRGQTDGLRKHCRGAGAGHAVQRLVPPFVLWHAEPRDRRGIVAQLRDLLFERHACDEIGGPRFEAAIRVAIGGLLARLGARAGSNRQHADRKRQAVAHHQSHIVPSARRAIGNCFGTYGNFAGELLVEGDAMPGRLAAEQSSVAEHIVVREDFIGLLRVDHPLLDAEVRHPGIEVQRCAHADRRQVGRTVEARAHLVECREVREPAHVRNAAGMHDRRADEVDQVLLDEMLAIPDGVEDLADRQRRHGVMPDQLERVLILGRRRVLQPEQPIRLQLARQSRGLDRRQTMMCVMQQLDVVTVVHAQLFEQFRHEAQILRRGPLRFERQRAFGRLVRLACTRDAVGFLQAGYGALSTHRAKAQFDMPPHFVAGLGDVAAIGMTVNQCALSRASTQQLIQRHARELREDVPQRDIDCGNRRHRHRPPSPVRAAIEKLPGVLDPSGVATDQVGNDVLLQVRGNGELAAIQRRVAEPDDARARLDPERDEIAPWTGDDHARVHDLAIADRAFWSHGCTSIWNGPAGSGAVSNNVQTGLSAQQ